MKSSEFTETSLEQILGRERVVLTDSSAQKAFIDKVAYDALMVTGHFDSLDVRNLKQILMEINNFSDWFLNNNVYSSREVHQEVSDHKPTLRRRPKKITRARRRFRRVPLKRMSDFRINTGPEKNALLKSINKAYGRLCDRVAIARAESSPDLYLPTRAMMLGISDYADSTKDYSGRYRSSSPTVQLDPFDVRNLRTPVPERTLKRIDRVKNERKNLRTG